MAQINNVQAEDLMKEHYFDSPDFDLLEFVPSSLSVQENEEAINTMSEFLDLFAEKLNKAFDLCTQYFKLQADIKALKEKLQWGCWGSTVIYVISFALCAVVFGLLMSANPVEEGSPVGIVTILSLLVAVFVSKWLKKLMINQEEAKKLNSLSKTFSELPEQINQSKRELYYSQEETIDAFYAGVSSVFQNLSATLDLLKKRNVVLKDTTLSPSACLLALEQLYSALRQEKHNKAMVKATYEASERMANEIQTQSEANRMVAAFLTGLSHRD